MANAALTFAHARAVPIAWWYRALNGASIRDLEQQWEASASTIRAVLSARRIRKISIVVAASVLVPLMIVDGPLLQRSVSVRTTVQRELVTLNFTLPQEVPKGFSGLSLNGSDFLSGRAFAVGEAWSVKEPISLDVQPACEGVCLGKVIGPGVVRANCSSASWAITSDMYFDPKATWGTDNIKHVDGSGGLGRNPIFVIDVASHMRPPSNESYLSTLASDSEALHLYTGNFDFANGTGTYNETKCWWLPATMEYSVQFDSNNQVALVTDEAPRLVSLANNSLARIYPNEMSGQFLFTLDSLTEYLKSTFQTNVTAIWVEPGYWSGDEGGVNAQAIKYGSFDSEMGSEDDTWRYTDPTADIVEAFENMLFRAAAATATWSNLTSLIDPGLSPYQSTVANQTVTRDVYHSSFRWYAGAAALELLAALVTLPMFFGWWRLPCHLNLSPFEIGLALEAPLMHDIDPASGAAGVLEELGDLRVHYDAGRLVERGVGARRGTESDLEGSETSSELKGDGVMHNRTAD